MAHRSKHIRGEHVTSWVEDDGCGVVFSRHEDSDDQYLLIQRHFEEPDDGRPYIETDDEDFCGHFRHVLGVLRRDVLEITYGSKAVFVTFALSEESFQGVARALRVPIPGIQLIEAEGTIRHDGG